MILVTILMLAIKMWAQQSSHTLIIVKIWWWLLKYCFALSSLVLNFHLVSLPCLLLLFKSLCSLVSFFLIGIKLKPCFFGFVFFCNWSSLISFVHERQRLIKFVCRSFYRILFCSVLFVFLAYWWKWLKSFMNVIFA